jgi:hypothetical protein
LDLLQTKAKDQFTFPFFSSLTARYNAFLFIVIYSLAGRRSRMRRKITLHFIAINPKHLSRAQPQSDDEDEAMAT